MSNRFHNKFHRQNHHSRRTTKNESYTDAAYDPIASFEVPFQGEFYSEGDILTTKNLSAQKDVFAENATIKNDLTVQNDVVVSNNLSVQQDLFVSGNSTIDGNLVLSGNLTATGITTFATTSSLSVVHIGSGPAAWIGNEGTGDIATFYDIDAGVEIFHIGGNNGTHPNVGVKTSEPNVDFTVNGEISASEGLYAKEATFAQQITSNGAIFLSSISLSNNLIANVLDPISGQDASTKNYVDAEINTLSSETFNAIVDTKSALAVTITSLSSELYKTIEELDVTLTSSITSLSVNVTVVQSTSANWESVYNSVATTSASFIKTTDTPTPGISAVTTIVAVSALPLVQEAGTVYLLI